MGSKFDALKSVDEDVVEKLKKYKKENAVLKSQNFDKDQQFQEAAKLAEHKRQKQLGENAILRAALEKDAPGSAEAVVATGMDGTIQAVRELSNSAKKRKGMDQDDPISEEELEEMGVPNPIHHAKKRRGGAFGPVGSALAKVKKTGGFLRFHDNPAADALEECGECGNPFLLEK